MTPELVSKLPQVGTTVFTVMSELAARHGAVNLGQGFPDDRGPREVLAEAARALLEDSNQYPSMWGVPALRQRLIASGELPTVRIGKSRLVRRDDFDTYVASLPTDTTGPTAA